MNSFPFDGKPVYAGHLGSVIHIIFSSTGEFFVTTSSNDGTVRLWRTQSGELIRIFYVRDSDGITFSADGRRLIVVGSGAITHWDIATGSLVETKLLRGLTWTAISSTGKWIAIREFKDDIPFIRIRELETFRLRYTLRTDAPEVWDGFRILGFSANEGFFLCGDEAGSVTLNLHTGERHFSNKPEPESAFFEDRHYCTCNGRETVIRRTKESLDFVDILDGSTVNKVPWSEHIWNGVNHFTSFHHSNRGVILGYYKGATVVDFDSGESVAKFLRRLPWYRSAAVSPDDGFLILASDDGSIEVYETATWGRVYTVPGGSTEMDSMAVDCSNRYLITLPGKGKCFAWDLLELRLVGEYPTSGYESTIQSSGHGHFLVARSNDTTTDYSYRDFENPIFLLQDETTLAYFPSLGCLRMLHEPTTEPYEVRQARSAILRFQRRRKKKQWTSIVLSPNGDWVALLNSETIALIEVPTGKGWKMKVNRKHTIGAPSISNNGLIAAATDSGLANVFDVQKRKVVASIQICDTSGAVALSPDGKTIAAGDAYNSPIDISSVRTKANHRILNGHAGGMRSLAFTPDGNTLISAAKDGQIVLWDTLSWERRATLMVFANVQSSPLWIAYTPQGKWNGREEFSKAFVSNP